MAGYFGTDIQTRLQRRSDERAAWTRSTPGACHIGRMLGTDDVDRFGLPIIVEIIESDGACGFRMIPEDRAASLAEMLTGRGYRVDFWDVFMADRTEALAAADAILVRPLPDGITLLELPTVADTTVVRRVQEFLSTNGIVPFSASMLVGEIVPATTVVLADAEGAIVATANAHLPHNGHSRFHDAAWGGLVAVAESERGRKLGNHVNALMVRAAFDRLGAGRIYELAAATNLPSRRMIESCGLRLEPTLKCGNATAFKEKFTR